MIQGAPDGFGYLTPDNFTPASYLCGRLKIPDNQTFLAAVMGALADLAKASSWEPFGSMTPTDAAYMALQMYNDFVQSRGTCMIGYVFPALTASAPIGCLLCDGSGFLRVNYPDLYAVLDPVFIIDADTFILPDLRGWVIAGANGISGVGLTVGATTGEVAHTLIETEMPAHTHTNSPHTHTLTPHSHAEGIATPAIAAILPPPDVVPSAVPGIGSTGLASDGISSDSITIDSAGEDQSHNNIQPTIGLNYYVIAK